MASEFGDNLEQANSFGSPKIALLIDFDNVILGLDDPGFDVELVVNALRERGQIVLGRCYGDWYRHNRHRRKLMEHGLELVETPAFGPIIKNSADIRIALDGYEIGMTQHHIDTFCIVSGDSDFLPLIKKLQFLGKKVLVICGNRFTSDMVRRNCNEFIAYENLLAASVGALEDATTLEGSFSLLHRAMEALREAGRDVRTSTLKQMMLQLNPIFSERSLGCSQFRFFLDKAIAKNLIKYGPRDRTSGELHVLLPEEDEAPIVEKAEARENRNSEARHLENRSEGRSETGRRWGKVTDRETKTEKIGGEEIHIETASVTMEIEAPVAEASDHSALPDEAASARFEPRPSLQDTPLPPRYDRNARRAARRFGVEPPAPTGETPENAPAPSLDLAPQETEIEGEIAPETLSREEVAEHALTRSELLARGMRVGARRFGGKNGTQTASETPAETTVQPEIISEPVVEATPETLQNAEPLPAKRTRSRRKKTKVEASEAPVTEAIVGETTPSETPVPESPVTQAPVEETPVEIESAPEIVAAVEAIEEAPATSTETPKTKTPRRRTSAKKAAPPTEVPTEIASEPVSEAAPETPAKKPRARRTTKKATE